MTKFEKKECDNLTNWLYTLFVTIVTDVIDIKEIAENTIKDPVLNKLMGIN